ncbi:Phage protein [Candidatus Arthromitus sp. SFB-mouse-NL]|uniref:baseplate J/gp47 family protein n=1 Tax=Candidatus Arthromitus sp. SFB-mouse-NL TaxID=1508644 RepID=UPI00049A8200|nr:baseplate J/gp47 family protein [Candidatus Arthromitus sp. SFB-mouse-NL]AID44726.1 Phage protein [Candidatus Arthromitus sp. SFB-mouse-NL]
MFDIHTEQEIKERIFKNIKSDLDKSEGSILNDIVSAITLEIINNQVFFKNGFLASFIETAKGEFLDLRCKEHGVYRKQGEKAKGIVILKSNEDIEIEEGTIIINERTGLRYIIKEDSNSNNLCRVVAEDIGSNYNLIKGNKLVLFKDNLKIGEIEIIEDIIGGENIESDDELRKRVYFVVANPEGVGTVTDYERWALEVDGVKIAKALPCFYGNGTVKVIVGGEYGSVLNNELVQKVQDYICPLGEKYGQGKAPIGATVIVTTFEKVSIRIKINGLKIEDTYDLDIIKLKLKESIQNYLLKVKDIIRYNEIISIVIDSYGVLDFDDIYINNSRENRTLEFHEKGILDEILYE